MGARVLGSAALAGALALSAACGGSDGAPTSPSGGGGGTTTTITITSAGVVAPRDVTVAAGSRVTFVNNHSAPHEMYSDPHPEHGSCPPLDAVGLVNPGQSRTSGNLNTPGVCRYHDHGDDTNTNLQGVIRVQ